jgi:hypothetical protein
MNGAALSREDQTIKRHARERVSSRAGFVSSQERDPPHGCRPGRFRYFSAASPKVGNVPSAADWL